MNDIEIWKSVVGFEDGYMVSSFGNIKSIDRYVINSLGRKIQYKSKALIKLNVKGYLKVNLPCFDKIKMKQKMYSIHRLVAIAFLPNHSNLPQVNHIDGNKQNNHLINLEWCTGSENIVHAVRSGLRISAKGELSPVSILTDIQVIEIREIGRSKKLYEIAKMFNISDSNVSAILRRKLWKHV